MTQFQRLDGVARALANDVELPLQRILIHVLGAATDKDLPNNGFDGFDTVAESRVVHGHIAPAEQHLAFSGNRPLNLLLASHP